MLAELVPHRHEPIAGHLAGYVDLRDAGVRDAGHHDDTLVEQLPCRTHREGGLGRWNR